MKRLFILCLFINLTCHAQTCCVFQENQNDNDLLEPYLFRKRQEDAQCNPLGLSGDVRTRGRFEKTKDAFRGDEVIINTQDDRVITITPDFDEIYSYKAELNLYLDQCCGPFSVSAKLNASSNLAVSTGTFDAVKLKRALIRYQPYDFACKEGAIYAEIGRQAISDKFDSEVMYASPLDGGFVHVMFPNNRWTGTATFQAAFLVVDNRKGQYGFIVSGEACNIYNTGLYVNYSLIDWGKDSHFNLFFQEDVDDDQEIPSLKPLGLVRPSYTTSQIILGYAGCICDKPFKVFGAFLYNHNGVHLVPDSAISVQDLKSFFPFNKEKKGAYIGFEYNKVKKCGDWAFKAELQYVEAFVFPEFDNDGIGLNVNSDNGLFTLNNADQVIISNVRSRLNYWGPKVQIAVGFCTNVSAKLQYTHSWTIKDVLELQRNFQRFDLQMIYSF